MAVIAPDGGEAGEARNAGSSVSAVIARLNRRSRTDAVVLAAKLSIGGPNMRSL
jgi:hypothetical protein